MKKPAHRVVLPAADDNGPLPSMRDTLGEPARRKGIAEGVPTARQFL